MGAQHKTQQKRREESMKVSEFANPRPVFKFTTIGDRLEGVIVEQPELQPDKFGEPGDKQLLLVVRDDHSEWRLYARKQMLDKIAGAVVAADVDEIANGGWLSVEYADDKPTGSGTTPMKVYAAEYVPQPHWGAARSRPTTSPRSGHGKRAVGFCKRTTARFRQNTTKGLKRSCV
jgi:hypothetical protein